MGSTIPAGYAQISLEGTPGGFNGSTPTLIFGLKLNLLSLNAATTAWESAWNTNVFPEFLTVFGPQRIVAVTDTERQVYSTTPVTLRNGTPIEPNVAVLVHKSTGLRGRAHAGRMYLPCALRDEEADGTGLIDDATQLAYQTGFENYEADLSSAGLNSVLLHGELDHGRGADPRYTPNPLAPDLITSWTVEPYVATQRRRLRG